MRDASDMFLSHDAREEKKWNEYVASCPICKFCDSPITDDGYFIDGEWYCEDCIEDCKKEV